MNYPVATFLESAAAKRPCGYGAQDGDYRYFRSTPTTTPWTRTCLVMIGS